MRLQLTLVLLAACASGCASVREHLPWKQAPAAAPTPVRELRITVPEQGQVPIVLQFWERNTLVVDLTAVAARGSVQLRPGEGRAWPARLALRFQPGRFEAVEIRGAQRAVFPVTADTAGAATVEVPPAVHAGGVGELSLRWGPKDGF